MVVAAVAAQCWLPQLDRQPAHLSHPLSTAVGSEFAVNIGHAHLTDDSASLCPPLQASAVIPRSHTPAFEAAVVVVASGIAGVLTAAVVVAGRGPPTLPVDVRTGQDLLTRFCLSRC